MNKFKLLTITIIVLTLLIGAVWNIYPKNNKNLVELLINEQLGQQNRVNNFVIGNSKVTTATRIDLPVEGDRFPEYSATASPMLFVRDLKTDKIKSYYEITFSGSSRDSYDKGNMVMPEIIEQLDVDDDSDMELVTSWTISWGGSDGNRGMIIADTNSDNSIIFRGFPVDSADSFRIRITNKQTKKYQDFGTLRSSDFFKFASLKNNAKYQLLSGNYLWKQEEGHYGDHIWDLYAYELSKNWLNIPKWWNDGKPYETTEKIGFESNDIDKLQSLFYSRVQK